MRVGNDLIDLGFDLLVGGEFCLSVLKNVVIFFWLIFACLVQDDFLCLDGGFVFFLWK